jgi:hypothetical protein
MDISTNIDNIKKQCLKHRLENELKFIDEGNMNVNNFVNSQDINLIERKEQIKKILELTDYNKTQPCENNHNNSNSDGTIIVKTKDELFKNIDKYIFKKQWNKLNSVHKKIKIKEYVLEKYSTYDFHQEIIGKLDTLINEDKINTKKYVIYDPNSEKILSIPILTVDPKKNQYMIKV